MQGVNTSYIDMLYFYKGISLMSAGGEQVDGITQSQEQSS